MFLKPPSFYSECVSVLCRKAKLAMAWAWPLSLYRAKALNSWSYAYTARFLSTSIALLFTFPIKTVNPLKEHPLIKVVILFMIHRQPQSQCGKYVYLQHHESCSGVDRPPAATRHRGPCRSVGSRTYRILNFPGIFEEWSFHLTEAGTLDPSCYIRESLD